MTAHKHAGTARLDSPPLYEVQELSLEEAMLLLAAEREEQTLREAQKGAKAPAAGRPVPKTVRPD